MRRTLVCVAGAAGEVGFGVVCAELEPVDGAAAVEPVDTGLLGVVGLASPHEASVKIVPASSAAWMAAELSARM